LSYRSQSDITLEGNYEGLATASVGKPGQSVSGELELNLPEIIEFSGYHQLNQQIALHYSAMYIGWDSFQELKATSSASNCNDGTAGQC
ncbi:outer membrane protein transport protein, partial [Streptococcus pyogenes]